MEIKKLLIQKINGLEEKKGKIKKAADFSGIRINTIYKLLNHDLKGRH